MKTILSALFFVISPVLSMAWTCHISTTGLATNSGSRDNPTAAWSGSYGYALDTSTNIIHLDGSPDLSTINTSGENQDSVYIGSATNTNQKIFAITAVDDVNDTVTTREVVTGMAVSSFTWTIGGRHLLTNATVEGSIYAGDIVEFNDAPGAKTAAVWTVRNAGDSTSGFVTIRGKAGSRPILLVTNTSNVLSLGSKALVWVENLELQQQGASGAAIVSVGVGSVIKNVKISDAGADGIQATNPARVIGCEISGVGGAGLTFGNTHSFAYGNYIHDLVGYGIQSATINGYSIISKNIIDTVGKQGIYFSQTPTSMQAADVWYIEGNTVYNSGQSGLEIVDKDYNGMFLANNIFKDNGEYAYQFNVAFATTTASQSFNFTSVGFNNIFNISGARGGANYYQYTLNSTDLTTDPLFTDAAAGDFSLQTASPAKASGFPGVFLGGSTGYLDMGAVQRQESSSGGGSSWHIGYFQ